MENGLLSLARQANLHLLYPSSLTAQKQTSGLNGSFSSREAVARLLAGTGLTYSFSGANTVTISDRVSGAHSPAATDGSLVLNVINVTGGAGNPADEPYVTPGSSAYISQQSIERFRGTSPADIFRGTPGVLSGESRNGAAVDINIRGMQGMGRVNVTVDGATNSTTVYQGYQGVGNRTYIDPDLIGGIKIEKGPSSAPGGGIGGSVSMSTISADDILDDGKSFGVRLKGGAGTNSSESPVRGDAGGIVFYPASFATHPRSSPKGLDRPAFLEPTRGYGSVAAAGRGENFEVVAAYAARKSGNYYAGANGPSARSSGNLGPGEICAEYPGYGKFCYPYSTYYKNLGLTAYRAGEKVLNSSSDTKSWLAKGKFAFAEDHNLELSYTGFRSEHGEARASSMVGPGYQPTQSWLSTASTDSGTARYRWKPSDNDHIDLRANMFVSSAALRNPTNAGFSDTKPLGLPNPVRTRVLVGSDTLMWGGDITNTSRFHSSVGDLSCDYGASYLDEDAEPTRFTRILEKPFGPRNGTRKEAAAFVKSEWSPTDWMTFDGGLRYQAYATQDRSDLSDTPVKSYPGQTDRRSGSGVVPSFGVEVTPLDGVQLFGRYTEGLRMPSLTESASIGYTFVMAGLRPERAHNWEFGVNVDRNGLISADDEFRLKAAFFDNTVKDYVSRQMRLINYEGSLWTGLFTENIYAAKFQGIELSGRYGKGGFSAEFGANYYTDVSFCPTADTCNNRSLYADYATNQVPPQYSLSLTLSQQLFDDRLTVGGRVVHTGPRTIGHDNGIGGAAPFIAQVKWEPYTLVDVFAEYKINDNVTANFRVENLTDQYYVDPLGLGEMPGPGRTAWAGLTAKF
ncbi:TonB-dependent receptor [Aminobacter sp. AP02]|uniref:TonB-dependent receptor n=1 Tax=Aminobacter sp. AP02 TaxID=2135737 RepID=UPI001304DB70|nr:TonB-dependent receptor [Aminobacter sp. AP02]